MKEDEFEQRIGKQAFREVPSEWRKQLLEQAVRGAAPRAGEGTHPSVAVGLLGQLRALLWPCPEAWAGLAAIWIGLLMVHGVMSHNSWGNSFPSSPSRAWATTLKDQEKLLAELIGKPTGQDQKSPKTTAPLTPRSARREEFFHA